MSRPIIWRNVLIYHSDKVVIFAGSESHSQFCRTNEDAPSRYECLYFKHHLLPTQFTEKIVSTTIITTIFNQCKSFPSTRKLKPSLDLFFALQPSLFLFGRYC